ncbi:hypothetical protein H0W32_03280, partial [Patescibacteria group bacterium]|nr:hypothetical protein [Patescibacteria group bacterium]
MSYRIRLKREDAVDWASANPILGLGESGYDVTNKQIRVGDGLTPWNDLTPIGGGGGGSGGVVATTSEARAGVNNTAVMTPLRVKEATPFADVSFFGAV